MDSTAFLASKAQFKRFSSGTIPYCLLSFQMKMPGSVGTKKAKAVEQLLEELGVGERLIPKCPTVSNLSNNLLPIIFSPLSHCILLSLSPRIGKVAGCQQKSDAFF